MNNALWQWIFKKNSNASGIGFHPWERRHPGGQRMIATRIETPFGAFPAESLRKIKS